MTGPTKAGYAHPADAATQQRYEELEVLNRSAPVGLGLAGLVAAVVLGVRLLRAIHRSGDL